MFPPLVTFVPPAPDVRSNLLAALIEYVPQGKRLFSTSSVYETGECLTNAPLPSIDTAFGLNSPEESFLIWGKVLATEPTLI